jgi:O-antigen/teichoic acid export membrane protein
MITQLVTVPLYLAWLGQERFGIWLMILQGIQLLSLMTTWIAAPMVRVSAEACVRQDRSLLMSLYQTVSMTYLAGGAVLVLGALVCAPLAEPSVGSSVRPGELRIAALLGVLYVAVFMQFNLLFSILAGQQRLHVGNILLAALPPLGAAFGIGGLVLGLGLPGLAGGQLAALLGLVVVAWVLTRRFAELQPGTSHVSRQLLGLLLRSGIGHFGYSLAAFARQADVLLVGLVLGPAMAGVFGVAQKLADLAVQLLFRIPDSLAPTVCELRAAQELDALWRTQQAVAKATTALGVLAGVLLAFWGRDVASLWVGHENTAAPLVFVGLAFVVVLQAFTHSSFISLYGTDSLLPVARLGLLEAPLKVSAALIGLGVLGPAGAPLSTAAAQLVCTAWFSPWHTCRVYRQEPREYLRGLVLPALLPLALAVTGGLVVDAVGRTPGLRLILGIPTVSVMFWLGSHISGLAAGALAAVFRPAISAAGRPSR